uniref:Uncharacterized protein n=1 Tax=Meloidogyne enterolobii TaxID=390850 RepID=A0A6V7TT00_MELEN|nr:unnamed protein product [Meloidogyne enterolobii]
MFKFVKKNMRKYLGDFNLFNHLEMLFPIFLIWKWKRKFIVKFSLLQQLMKKILILQKLV